MIVHVHLELPVQFVKDFRSLKIVMAYLLWHICYGILVMAYLVWHISYGTFFEKKKSQTA